MTSSELEDAVRATDLATHWIPQCRVGCGHGDDGERTVDLWGISTKRPFCRVSVEIKVSRSDFLRDLRAPLKQRRARLMANQFFFAVPAGMLTASDLPTWAGLIDVNDSGVASIAVQAPWFDASPPTWSFVASLVRRFEKACFKPTPNVIEACKAALDAVARRNEDFLGTKLRKARQALLAVEKSQLK